MKSVLGGLGLVAHGLAHALPGAQAGASGRSWLLSALGLHVGPLRWAVAILSTLAMTGFVASGFGVWGVRPFRARWKRLAVLAVTGSLALVLLFWINAYGVIAVAIDLVILMLVRRPTTTTATPVDGAHHVVKAISSIVAVGFVAWLGLVSLTAPIHRFWGSTSTELSMALPGDQALDGPPTYWIQHATTIHAPADQVWPWLAQLGTDRAGFYSYDFLERAAGIDMHNADRVHPEWQHVHEGDLVLATPEGYAGVGHPMGWKLSLVEQGRAMVLENWGAFVLVPVDAHTTRFIVRTRNGQPPSPVGLALSWLGLVTFEPVHFIMERGMLQGVKTRVERT